jgi:site-specific DNA recombinase
LGEAVSRVELRDDGIAVSVGVEVLCARAGVRTSSTLSLTRFVPLRMKRRELETRIILAAGDDLPHKIDPALLKAVAHSRAWFEELASGEVRSLAEIARREHIAVRYVERLAHPAFTAPNIVEAICQGRQPAELNTEALLNRIDLPLDWPAPSKALGID